ncbi:uncharacterized protein LOC131927875 [Physella acuta]|uniref:uncharacterized protein LOC131927875 n=1 Tax=Physella acuta TaxID=109671 RepID=UPI0027DC2296|nr:uncharacterized protein LOC131927875 [Physella acuta]
MIQISALLLLGVGLCLISITQAVPGASCIDNSQCGSGECCKENVQIVSRKRVPVLPWPQKICQTYFNEGESCSVFRSGCGCRKGLTCVRSLPKATPDKMAARLIIDDGSTYTCRRRFGVAPPVLDN